MVTRRTADDVAVQRVDSPAPTLQPPTRFPARGSCQRRTLQVALRVVSATPAPSPAERSDPSDIRRGNLIDTMSADCVGLVGARRLASRLYGYVRCRPLGVDLVHARRCES